MYHHGPCGNPGPGSRPLTLATLSASLLLATLLALAPGCRAPARPGVPAHPRPAPDHLKGDWQLTSTLSLRKGVGSPARLLFLLNRQVQDVLEGKLQIPGIPPTLTALAAPIVAQYLKRLVPPWARELARRIRALDSALGELRIVSIETLRPLGDNQYEGRSRWMRVTVRSGDVRITASARQVPGLGALEASSYSASEHTGHLRIRQLKVSHRLGRLYRWAAEALLGGITCSTKKIPCFRKVEQLLSALLPCERLAALVAKAAPPLANMVPLIKVGCQAQKARLIKELGLWLDRLSLRPTFLKLSGDARVVGDRLLDGRWVGSLGKAYGGQAIRGTFKGHRAGR